MTLQWTFTAGFLYGLMVIVGLMMLPMIPSKVWASIFKLPLVSRISSYANLYFNLFVGLLALMVFEALRHVWSQSAAFSELKAHPETTRLDSEILVTMRLFRAQRNLHIAGFALYMWFVFRRLTRLIAEQARLSASEEATRRQAQSASDTARRLMDAKDESTGKKTESSNSEVKSLKEEIDELKSKLETERKDAKQLRVDLSALQTQAKNTATEYDRVSRECQTLQRKLDAVQGDSRDKKAD